VVTVIERRDGELGRAPGLAAVGASEGGSLGAGFAVDAEGHVVTSRHVLGDATQVWLEALDGRRIAARVLGRDEGTDLAVVVIDPSERPLPPVPLGDSDSLAVGDWVVTVGSPFGLGQSFSAGVVSAVGRADIMDLAGANLIQTDAAVNPGNSGGPLADARGRVVGVTAAMRSDARGIGFAIPVNTLKAILPALIREGRVARSWIGLFVEPADMDDLPETVQRGARVSRVVAGGPAAAADVKAGDVVLAFDGRALERADDLRRIVAATAVGRRVVLRVWRAGAERDVGITTVARPSDAP
jgi:serine protease Do